jgi:23S rRNA pseudouridine1911/1915/1917 synthase
LRYFAASDISLVRFELLTGRTHQLRLHSQACGCPIVGETLYGRLTVDDRHERDHYLDAWDLLAGHQALHAASLRFRHPVSGKNMQVTAPLPVEFRRLLAALREQERESQINSR